MKQKVHDTQGNEVGEVGSAEEILLPKINAEDIINKISALTTEKAYWTCKWRFDVSLHGPTGVLSDFSMGRCNCTGHSGPLCSTDEKQWWSSRVRCDKDGNLLT